MQKMIEKMGLCINSVYMNTTIMLGLDHRCWDQIADLGIREFGALEWKMVYEGKWEGGR